MTGGPGSGTDWPASAEHREREGESSGRVQVDLQEKDLIQLPWIGVANEHMEQGDREEDLLDREAMAVAV